MLLNLTELMLRNTVMLRNTSKIITSTFGQRQLLRFAQTAPVASESLTIISEKDGVREITLNRPKTRNALSMAMMESIIKDITTDINNESLRCIVISSTGPVFSAGHNLKELTADSGPDSQRLVFEKCADLISQIYRAPVPIIAKVDGLAAAAGCQVVASCDILVCSEKSSFSTPGINFGLFCHTPGIAIGRVMPRMKASYMLITGAPISAQDAYISGLVSVVAPNDKLDEEVAKICDSIKAKSRPVIAMGKEFFYKQLGLNVYDAYNQGSKIMLKNLGLDDGKEGIQSFVEKRKPKWSNS